MENNIQAKSGKIENITLFNRGAEIVRTYKVNFEEGINKIAIGGFVNDKIVRQSISAELVSGKETAKICAVDYNQRAIRIFDTDSITKSLEAKLKKINDDQAELYEKLSILESEATLLAKTNTTELKVADIKELAKFYSTRLSEIGAEKIKTKKAIQENENSIKATEGELGILRSGTMALSSEIGLEVYSAAKQSAEIQLSYSIANASWSPKYDLRVTEKDKGNTATIALRAEVQQSTDEDWKDVKLTLSTSTQTLGIKEPVLQPWYMYAYEKNAIRYECRSDNKSKYSREDACGFGDAFGDIELCKSEFNAQMCEMQEQVRAETSVATTENNISVDYALAGKQTILTNKPKIIEVNESEIEATFNYFAIPKLNRNVFYMMHIENFANLDLLVGEINIIYNDKFVGTTKLNLETLGDTLDISLGQEKNILVKYDSGKENKRKGLLGSSTKESRSFVISVHNLKKRKVNLLILDQLPVSTDKVLVIEATEISGAKHDNETGELKWEFDLAENAKRDFAIKYTIAYPSNRYIS